ncbi:MAG: hypothetical protein HOC23_07570 [Halieaceae bacterium]|nr:hypothetical protein [Halieaceae bacterium]
MASSQPNRAFTLVQREMQEYRNSLFWTPIVIAGCLTLVMLLSVLLANRITVMGDAMMQVLMDESAGDGLAITIQIDEENGTDDRVDTEPDSYTITTDPGPANEEDWSFSRQWKFQPKPGARQKPPTADYDSGDDERIGSLNPMLNMLHNFLILTLLIVSTNYLLGSLFADRKDRSILFWKSMPVSEWEEILAKFGMAMVVAPIVFIAVSMIAQLASILLAMLMIWRLDMNPYEVILANIEFGPLFLNQIGGWILTMLWLAPFYAWLLLASAAAKRSPFMIAVAPIIGLIVVEQIFMGTTHLATALGNHLPHYYEEDVSSVGFYLHGPVWSAIDYTGLGLGLLVSALALLGCFYLRRYRFEL